MNHIVDYVSTERGALKGASWGSDLVRETEMAFLRKRWLSRELKTE